MFVATTDV